TRRAYSARTGTLRRRDSPAYLRHLGGRLPRLPRGIGRHRDDLVWLFDDSRLGQVWGALVHFTSPWNVVGFLASLYPSRERYIPAPIDLQLICNPHDDSALLRIAEQVEELLGRQ